MCTSVPWCSPAFGGFFSNNILHFSVMWSPCNATFSSSSSAVATASASSSLFAQMMSQYTWDSTMIWSVSKIYQAEAYFRCITVTDGAKKFRPTTDPFPGARDGQNIISWRWSLPLPTNPVWWGSIYAISSYRGNRPTPPARPPQTGAITIHCVTA